MISGRMQKHCSHEQLEQLLSNNEFDTSRNDEMKLAEEHLEECGECVAALERIAADQDSWDRLPLLQDHTCAYDPSNSASTTSSPSPASSPSNSKPHNFSFLPPAIHPELLGRLGRYDIESFLGAGGNGIVFKGFDTELNRPVAIKCLVPHLSHIATARYRFAREAKAAAAIVHENVVAIHNVETETDTAFLVMQYVSGPTLQARVEKEGPLPVETILRVILQAARGLSAAHAQGVIHRDIKPGNMLLEENSDRLLLTDFGLARAVDDASITQSGSVTGTPNYMSPEQARGESIDSRSDLFSLGAVLYFMAAGYPPFRAERAVAVMHRVCTERPRSLGQIRPDLPWTVIDIADKLLQKKANHRYSNASQLIDAASNALTEIQSPKKASFVGGLTRKLKRKAANFGNALNSTRSSSVRNVAVAGILILLASYALYLVKPDNSTKSNESKSTKFASSATISETGSNPRALLQNANSTDSATQVMSQSKAIVPLTQQTYVNVLADPQWDLEMRSLMQEVSLMEWILKDPFENSDRR